MPYEMLVLGNWLLAGLGMLASLVPAEWFDGSDDGADEDVVPETGLTETGSDAGDLLSGAELGDTLYGLGGNDTLSGAGGDDVLEGNTGDDTLNGDAGNDSLAGGGDTDTLFGGAGNDTLSVDRLDGDANWSRGDAESLDGGAGDDRLIFSMDDTATGGEGADQFQMVTDTTGDAAHVTDFTPGEDILEIYTLFLEGSGAPTVSVVANEDAGITTVSLDGTATVTLDGIFTEDDLSVQLNPIENLSL